MSFVCPHCGVVQIVTQKAEGSISGVVNVGEFTEMTDPEKASTLHLSARIVKCANKDCSRVSVSVILCSGYYVGTATRAVPDSIFFNGRVYPGSVGKPFPQYVPTPMIEDYQEAWSIIDLSPKSSATLARRCLQAMIRDFCGIKKRTLFDEIDTLRKLADSDNLPRGVDPDTIGAMLALKDVGNIGAHMSEVDGVILDVDPGEAEKLLRLIEMLFEDWYIARGKRAADIAAIIGVAKAKKPSTEA